MNARIGDVAHAVRAQADALIERSRDLQEEIPADLYRLTRDVAELAKVLARVLEGMPALRAFGAPGDWGYGTPMGQALRAALFPTAPEAIADAANADLLARISSAVDGSGPEVVLVGMTVESCPAASRAVHGSAE